MTPHATRQLLRDDSGISLPEVIIYIMVSVIVLAGLAGLFSVGLSAHAETEARNTATGTVAVAVSSLQSSIRNSSAFDVTGSILRARVAVGNGSNWECRAWSLSAGTLYYKTATSAITAPSDYEGEGWTALAQGVSAKLAAPAGTLVPFLRSGAQLQYGFEVRVGDAGTEVTLEGGATSQAAGAGSPTSCW